MAVATNMTLSCIFISTLLLRVHALDGDGTAFPGVGNMDYFLRAINVFNFLVIGVALLLLVKQFRDDRQFRQSRLLRTIGRHEFVTVSQLEEGKFHLFLSHSWGTGQDQMRVIKQRLLEMMPNVRVFLVCVFSAFECDRLPAWWLTISHGRLNRTSTI